MVAMSECGPQGCGSGLQYFLTDHLDSVVAVANASGGLVSQQRYMPFGEVRTDVGTITQTDFGYTGQRNLDAQGNSFSTGLMDYKARFYDPYITHFTQPDSIIPDHYDPQSLNRYAYARNNPIRYNDPTGHCISGAVADTVFCLYVGAMIVGGIVDAAINAHTQFEETGHIEWGEVGTHAVEGAVIAGAPFVALAAAPVVMANTGNTLSWAGANTGSPGLFNSGQGLTNASTSLTNFFSGSTTVSGSTSVIKSPQQIAADFGIDPASSPATEPYVRPNNATTAAQRASVQGQPCVNCGLEANKMIADHRVPLVVEYYKNGTIDLQQMRSLNAVQPQCPACSAMSGGYLSQFSRYIYNVLFSE
jgi:RHS repeat-associated protein